MLGGGAHLHCRGKGRKERCTPLRKEGRRAAPVAARAAGQAARSCFPNGRGDHSAVTRSSTSSASMSPQLHDVARPSSESVFHHTCYAIPRQ